MGGDSLSTLAERLRLLAARVGVDPDGRMRGFAEYVQLLEEPGADVERPVDVPALLDRLLDLTAGEVARHGAAIVRRLTPVPSVRATTRQLAQLFVKLLLNAAQATQPNLPGRIEVRTARDGDFVVVEIADNGHGIPLGLLPRIFEPHFSTKGSGGQGLGLPISRAIATALGGTLTVESRGAGFGATFRVRLPSATTSAAPSADP